MNEFLEETKSNLQKIIELEDEDPGVITIKRHSYFKEVLNSIESQKRKFKDDDAEPTTDLKTTFLLSYFFLVLLLISYMHHPL
jgi:hypothetical protein